jgi:hypothetical protein
MAGVRHDRCVREGRMTQRELAAPGRLRRRIALFPAPLRATDFIVIFTGDCDKDG